MQPTKALINMRKLRLILCLAMSSLFLGVSAQPRFNVRGGLSLTNNDISRITTESVQKEENYSGFFIGPALTMGDGLLGLDFALL